MAFAGWVWRGLRLVWWWAADRTMNDGEEVWRLTRRAASPLVAYHFTSWVPSRQLPCAVARRTSPGAGF